MLSFPNENTVLKSLWLFLCIDGNRFEFDTIAIESELENMKHAK